MKLRKSMNKYKNKKIIINGIKFDSIKESKRYNELILLEKAHEIKDLELQKEFILQEAFDKNNKHYRKISYIADFYYFDLKRNKWIVEDVKGMRTDIYKLKKKMFEYKYKDLEIEEI